MREFPRIVVFTVLAGAIALLQPGPSRSFDDPEPKLPPVEFNVPPPDVQVPKGDFEIDTRGPVHEAFAQPYQATPETPPAVKKEPPPPLPEKPPAERPDSPNLEWIPGYWAWDADRNDYVWVSGMFRDPPLGRRWVPGHWANTPDGWSWASGFWAPENQQNLQYAPQPPAPLEDGPAVAAPDENSTYIPGYWFYDPADQRFAWRPGYWAPFRDNRVWVNPQYYWTPNGYLYNPGYWDCDPSARGMLFAPAYFPTPLWNNPGWFYQPSYGINVGFFFGSGFYRPGFPYYFFGNYYGPRYAGLGYRPWWGYGYNPMFNYYQWQHRSNPQWLAQQQQLHNARMTGKAAVPPTTLAQQHAMQSGPNAGPPAVTPIKQFTPLSGKMVPNTQLTAQNLQIRNAQDIVKTRAAAESAQGLKVANVSPAAAAPSKSLSLPPSPPRVRPLGAPNPATTANLPASPTPWTNARALPGNGVASTPAIAPSQNRPAIVGSSAPAIGAAGAPAIKGPAAVGNAVAPSPAPQIINSVKPANVAPAPTIVHAPSASPAAIPQPRIINNPAMSAPAPNIANPAAIARPPQMASPSISSQMAPRSFAPPSMPSAAPRISAAPRMGSMPSMGGMPRMGGGMPSMGGMRMGGGMPHVGGGRH